MSNENILPVSIKGIVIENNRIWLRKNPRGEWELPGGRLEAGEQPEVTVMRELKEELGFITEAHQFAHSGVLEINLGHQTKRVFVVSYLCSLKERVADFEFNGEDGPAEFNTFSIDEIDSLNLPTLYRNAISSAMKNLT